MLIHTSLHNRPCEIQGDLFVGSAKHELNLISVITSLCSDFHDLQVVKEEKNMRDSWDVPLHPLMPEHINSSAWRLLQNTYQISVGRASRFVICQLPGCHWKCCLPSVIVSFAPDLASRVFLGASPGSGAGPITQYGWNMGPRIAPHVTESRIVQRV